MVARQQLFEATVLSASDPQQSGACHPLPRPLGALFFTQGSDEPIPGPPFIPPSVDLPDPLEPAREPPPFPDPSPPEQAPPREPRQIPVRDPFVPVFQPRIDASQG